MRKTLISIIAATAVSSASATGIPVIDITAIGNLIQQLAYWQQQIAAMASQLQQLQQTHGSMTGGRGMHAVLPATELQRNYLPPTYRELINVVNGNSATYAGLSAYAQATLTQNAVLTGAQLGSLGDEGRLLIESRRRSAAMVSSLAQVAYQQTSQRFGALQSMISLIASAGDQKAILDLQGRISAEQALLTNEQTKLQTLHQLLQAQQITEQQRIREGIVRGHGSFESRFSPQPTGVLH